ncbi:MAG: Sensor histidine kinase CitA [Chloroflexi bacterium ADurb.Bin325]|nr:MAG: Sensor histidine kinase CitA [Chloroflexi bacterium ADurb.Bin325]
MLVLDADLGLANLDVVLNLYPKITLHDVFTGKASLPEAVLPAPGGFHVLLAGSGMVEYSRMTPEVRDQLLEVIDTVAPRYDHVILDTGAGIEPWRLPTLFETGETTTADRYAPAHGLGLWWTRGQVESFGGTIDVDSRPAAGTRFTIRLRAG